MCSTVMRVPAMTGLPNITFGSRLIRGCCIGSSFHPLHTSTACRSSAKGSSSARDVEGEGSTGVAIVGVSDTVFIF